MKILMSKKEANYTAIIPKTVEGRFTNQQAANLLNISVRQVQRLKKKWSETKGAILHGNRGKNPQHAISNEIKEKIVALYQNKYNGYNFTHFTEQINELEKIRVSRKSVERILKEKGIPSPKQKKSPKRHKSRKRKEKAGELVQLDASIHDWFQNGTKSALHGAIDDATGEVLALRFENEECYEGYAELMMEMNLKKKLPAHVYVDGRTVFVYSKPRKLTIEEELAGFTDNYSTNFARGLHELEITMTIASSPQAKGRIERLWETLQDRLLMEMKTREIKDINDANTYVKEFIPQFNKKFQVLPFSKELAYLPSRTKKEMEHIFASYTRRVLDNGLSFSFHGKKYVLTEVKEVKPKQAIIVAYSCKIGVKVLLQSNRWITPLLLEEEKRVVQETQKNIHAEELSKKRAEAGRKGAAASPWRKSFVSTRSQ